MHLIDANVLIYAFRRDSPYHAPCYEWLISAMSDSLSLATTALVEVALLRIATLPALGNAAAPIAEVFNFLAALKAQPSVVQIDPGDRHFALFEALCADLGLRGNDVNDAYLAALALERDATLVTADSGFKRFTNVRLFDPLAVA